MNEDTKPDPVLTPAQDAVAKARQVYEDAQKELKKIERANKENVEREQMLVRQREELVTAQVKFRGRLRHFQEVFKHVLVAMPDNGLILKVQEPSLNESLSSHNRLNRGSIAIVQKDDSSDDGWRMTSVPLNLETAHTSTSSWHSRENGFKFVVGNYGNKSTYPQKKDGSFNYEKIASTWIEKTKAKMAEQQHYNDRRSAKQQSQAILDGMQVDDKMKGSYSYGPVTLKASEGDSKKVVLEVKMVAALLPEDAANFVRRFNDLMVQVGEVLKQYDAK